MPGGVHAVHRVSQAVCVGVEPTLTEGRRAVRGVEPHEHGIEGSVAVPQKVVPRHRVGPFPAEPQETHEPCFRGRHRGVSAGEFRQCRGCLARGRVRDVLGFGTSDTMICTGIQPHRTVGRTFHGSVKIFVKPIVLLCGSDTSSLSARCLPSGTRVAGSSPGWSASVKRNWAPGCGRSLRTIGRIPLGQPFRQSLPASSSATQAPSRTSPSGSTAGVHADAGTFKTAWWMASVMVIPTEYDSHLPRTAIQTRTHGCHRRITTDQRLPPAPVLLGQLGQGQSRSLDVVRDGIGACIPGPQQAHHRFSGSAPSVVDEAHQRVVAVGLLPGRGGVLLVGVRNDEHPVQVHDHLPAGVRRRNTGHLPGAFSDFGPGGADRRQGAFAARGECADEPRDGRVGGDRPEHGGSARSVATSARQSPPRATASATSSRILPGSCTARGLRHGASATDTAASRPVLRTVSTSSTDPAWETTERPAALDADTRVRPDTLLHLGIASFLAANRALSKSYRWQEHLPRSRSALGQAISRKREANARQCVL